MQCCSLQSVVDKSFRSRHQPPRKPRRPRPFEVPQFKPSVPSALSSAPALSALPAPAPAPSAPALLAHAAPASAAPVASASPAQSVTVRGITVTMADVARVSPVLTFHPNERHFPCDIENVLAGACLKGADNRVLVQNPTQADLAAHPGADNRLWLAAGHAGSTAAPADNRVTAPMYVIVQVPEDRSYVELRYVLLFAYQGAQVVQVMVPGRDFDTFLPHFGEHEGDIENVCVRLTPDLQQVTSVTFEHHGQPQTYAAADVAFEGSHPVARCALEDHATYNARGLSGDARVEHTEETRQPIPGFGVGFVDLVSDRGARWAPHERAEQGAAMQGTAPFIFIGLDKDGRPVGNQVWAAYAGAIGGCWRNDYAGAQGVGENLSFFRRHYVNGLVKAVLASGKLEEKRRASNGTPGLGGRPWIHMEA